MPDNENENENTADQVNTESEAPTETEAPIPEPEATVEADPEGEVATPEPEATPTPASETLPDDDAAIVEQPDDPVENTGAGEPAADPAPVSSIEAAATAAADAEPAPAEATPTPEPEPEPVAAAPVKGRAPATARTKRKPRVKDKTTATIQNHLAKLKSNRPEPEAAPEPTAEETAAVDAKAKKRARLDAILVELRELDDARDALHAEQHDLVHVAAATDTRTFHEKLQAVQARGAENRERRQRDRLKLLAQGAGKSPIDQALSSRPRNRPDLEPAAAAASE